MDKKAIIFGVIGIVVLLYIVKKLQPGETQTITQMVPVGSVNNASNVDAHALYDTNKTQAFLGVLELGKADLAARVQAQNIATQVPLENVRKDVALASFDRDLQLGGLSSKTAIQLAQLQSDSELQAARIARESASDLLQAQIKARAAEIESATNAINSAGITYRNQSLERQGTILNALTTLYTGQAPYNYQSAFGGTRPPSILQQLFPGGIGSTIKDVFSFF